jgi:SAM-dependent methyltransferase
MENPEWFKDIHFWELYGPIMFDRKRWDEVPLVADGVARLAKLDLYHNAPAEGPKVLDLCCGFGRIALELARRGFSGHPPLHIICASPGVSDGSIGVLPQAWHRGRAISGPPR